MVPLTILPVPEVVPVYTAPLPIRLLVTATQIYESKDPVVVIAGCLALELYPMGRPVLVHLKLLITPPHTLPVGAPATPPVSAKLPIGALRQTILPKTCIRQKQDTVCTQWVVVIQCAPILLEIPEVPGIPLTTTPEVPT